MIHYPHFVFFRYNLMLLKIGKLLSGKTSILKNFYTVSASTKMSTGELTGVKLTKVVSVLEEFAPKNLAESWDNTGLLVEPYTPR